MNTFLPSGRHFLLLLSGIVLLFASGSFFRGLNEPDEGRYANIALEMLEPGGSWMTPVLSDYEHYDKPPLVYWLTAASLALFGRHEWAARLPSIFGALAGLAGMAWMAWRLYGVRTAWWSLIVCSTLLQFAVFSTILTPDMLLTGFCMLAAGAWAEGKTHNRRIRWWLVSLLFWIAAWHAKATTALIPLSGMALGLLLTGNREGLGALRPLRTVAAIILLSSPWYLLMMAQHPGLADFFFGREIVGRIGGHPDGRHGPIYYHLGVCLIAWLPWWPWAFRRHANRSSTPLWRRIPLEGWVVVFGIGFYSMISSKLPAYTLPFAPWLAVWCAKNIVNSQKASHRSLYGTAAIAAACYMALGIAIPAFESRLSRNSSIRPVAVYLLSHQADHIYFDKYWPGAEFYLPENKVHYLEKPPVEREGDPGDRESEVPHFVVSDIWPELLESSDHQSIWIVLFQDKNHEILKTLPPGFTAGNPVVIGNFRCYPISSSDG